MSSAAAADALLAFLRCLPHLAPGGCDGTSAACDDAEDDLSSGIALLRGSTALLSCCEERAAQHQRQLDAALLTVDERMLLARWRAACVAGVCLGVVLPLAADACAADLATLLLVCAVKSPLKEAAVTAIMAMQPTVQQALMVQIRCGEDPAWLRGVTEPKVAARTGSEEESDARDAQLERLQHLLDVAETEARDANRAACAAKAEAEVQHKAREQEIERLRMEISAAMDERDVAKHQAKQVPMLQKTIQRYESKMDEFESLSARLVESNSVIKSLKMELANKKDFAESNLSLKEKLEKSLREIADQDARLHGVEAERDALAHEVKKLSTQVISLEVENRHLHDRLESSTPLISNISCPSNIQMTPSHCLIESFPVVSSSEFKIDELQQTISDQAAKLHEAQAERASFAGQVHALSSQVSSLEKQLQENAELLDKRALQNELDKQNDDICFKAERISYVEQINELHALLKSSQNDKEQLQRANDGQNKRLLDFEAERISLSHMVKEMSSKVLILEQKNRDLERFQKSSLAASNVDLENIRSSLRDQKTLVRHDEVERDAQVKHLSAKVSILTDENSRLSSMLESSSDMEDIRISSSEPKARVLKIKKECDVQAKHVAKLKEENSRLQTMLQSHSEVDEIRTSLHEQRAQVCKIEDERDALAENVKALSAKVEILRDENTRLHNMLELRSERTSDLKCNLDPETKTHEFFSRLRASEARKVQLQREVDLSTRRIGSLEEMLRVEEMNVKRVGDERDRAIYQLNELKQRMSSKGAIDRENHSLKSPSNAVSASKSATESSMPISESFLDCQVVREEMELMSSSLHSLAQEFHRRCLKNNSVSLGSSNSRCTSSAQLLLSKRK